ncbi:hypothetical protein [Nocardioides sp. TF02-7]|uniref:hypothetical protein n=1 Tax=Nocardioides sp. TF02-7 TaxID=2917724 RepID=UPI001F0584FA|nr:hypothetical protein [Nocardioides sp. TF02-7]UMG94232.1 hypothetical protein MF408_09555 [Nocardioides sp. TF02-7]
MRLLQPHYDALRDQPDAAAVVLELARALSSARMRLHLDFGEVAECGARIAELLGDAEAIADSYTGLALHYLQIGVHGPSRILLEAAAALARESHQPLNLARALVNLNAGWNQDDVARAVRFGREAVDVARRTGYRIWVTYATCNLLIAQWVSGEWDDALALSEAEDVDPAGASMVASIRALVLGARGAAPEPARPLLPASDDVLVLAWNACLRAVSASRAGDAEAALAAAWEAADRCYTTVALGDDFPVIWPAAVDVAFAHDDLALVRRLLTLVTDHVETRPGCGLRGQLARFRALLAVRSGDADVDVEAELRTAIDELERWHARPALALARRDLGRWLRGQGRAEEAAELLAEADAALRALGARGWLSDASAEEPTGPSTLNV